MSSVSPSGQLQAIVRKVPGNKGKEDKQFLEVHVWAKFYSKLNWYRKMLKLQSEIDINNSIQSFVWHWLYWNINIYSYLLIQRCFDLYLSGFHWFKKANWNYGCLRVHSSVHATPPNINNWINTVWDNKSNVWLVNIRNINLCSLPKYKFWFLWGYHASRKSILW